MASPLGRPWLLFTALTIIFQIATASPVVDRSRKSADGDITSLVAKLMKIATYYSSLAKKRSADDMDIPGFFKTNVSGSDSGSQFEELCYMWLYQSFVNDSSLDDDAFQAAQISSRFICPNLLKLIVEMTEKTSALHTRTWRE